MWHRHPHRLAGRAKLPGLPHRRCGEQRGAAFASSRRLRMACCASASNNAFATNPDTPRPGTRSIASRRATAACSVRPVMAPRTPFFPVPHPNDNLQNEALQQQAGTLAECTACHGDRMNTESSVRSSGGPHGLHTLGDASARWHHDHVDQENLGPCQTCHGTDLKGTVLSRALKSRTISGTFNVSMWKGYQVGCYTCHNGPSSVSAARPPRRPTRLPPRRRPPFLSAFHLTGTPGGGGGSSWRVVSQPAHGAVRDKRQSGHIPLRDRVLRDGHIHVCAIGWSERLESRHRHCGCG